MALLMEADPCESSIASYLCESWCFAAWDNNRVVAVCVVKPFKRTGVEVHNVVVCPNQQGRGIGSELLGYVFTQLIAKGIKRLELSTGAFGYQLFFYQRLGFRVDSVMKNHFLDNYPEPIFEQGIQHKDALRLYIHLGG